MGRKITIVFFYLFLISVFYPVYSQPGNEHVGSDRNVIDSLVAKGYVMGTGDKKPEVNLSLGQALEFLREKYNQENWKSQDDPLRIALGQLINEASNPPFDSAKLFLDSYPFDSISIPRDEFYIWEPVRFRVPGTVQAGKEPGDTIPYHVDIMKVSTDSVITDTTIVREGIVPSSAYPSLKDTTIMVMVDTLREVQSLHPGFPFRYYSFPYQSDSIKAAVRLILDYVEERDSSILNITGTSQTITPVWLNSKADRMIRYWLKNDLNDSVTVWIGNPARNTIGLYLEHGVSFRRPPMQRTISDAAINVQSVDRSTLLDIQKITTKSQFWKYRTETSFILNQGLVTNWVKGGESSISTVLDITFYADYTNKPLLVSSNHFARLKYGLIVSGSSDLRKNIDLLETNSKFNHKAFGRFDFSAIMLMKTQLAKGYNYPNDSVPVSKLVNPLTITLGMGLDYKPNKETSINFSPLSYKGTFVTDTVTIDHTKYGISPDKKSKHEPGVSFMISNIFRPTKNISVTNRLQLFTNYINNPQNIDVDWEMILVASLNWFTDVRLNTHLIFDDDTKTTVLDKNKNPVLDGNGREKKSARIQFKELLGFSFVFRF